MKNDKLFQKYYEPKLIEQGINNVVLRTYVHSKGHSIDDPKDATTLIFSSRKEVDQKMDEIFSETHNKKGIAITSIVSHKNKQKHLFLLDCSLPVSKANETELISILKESTELLPALNNGMILKTLNSYHVVAFVPLSFDEWKDHMAHVILLKNKKGEPVADLRYVGHSLIRGYGSLRISDYLDKPTPDFVCYI